MNIQPVFMRYDINRKIPFDRSSPIVVDHVEDYETRFIEVYVYESIYNKQVDLKGTTITARIVAALSTEKILLNDNVACTLNSSGNIIIPIDGAVIETLASTLLIEVRITQDTQALVLPFPLYVQMRGSILDDAGIAPESRGTIPELLEAAIAALEEAKNYENLENKPQINGHTLSGNKTSDNLGLQKKLTAGQNITIANDGTISAEDGGVTSYNDLTDKPTVQVNNSQIVPLSGKLMFTSGFSLGNYLPGELIRVGLRDVSRSSLENWQNYLYGVSLEDFDLYVHPRYNFNDLSDPLVGTDFTNVGYIRTKGEGLTNTPQIFSSNISNNSRVLIIHYNSIPRSERHHYLLRVIYFQDSSTNKIRQFAQWIYYISEQDTTVHSVTSWCEIGGCSQIVSGVVNQNGTITFTDSGGNTFTTTGASVIGPQGNPGQNYVLTEQDKSDIAGIVLGELPTTEGVLYGNTNN
mgnify:CR=1 FL=1